MTNFGFLSKIVEYKLFSAAAIEIEKKVLERAETLKKALIQEYFG